MFSRLVVRKTVYAVVFFVSAGGLCSSCQEKPSTSRVSSIPHISSSKDLAGIYPKTKEEVTSIKTQAILCFEQDLNRYLSKAKELHTFEDIVKPYDRMCGELQYHANRLSLVSMVAKDKDLRDESQQASEDIMKVYLNSRVQHPELFSIFQSIQVEDLSRKEAYYVQQMLSDMKLEGLHLDEEKRSKLKAIQSRILELGSVFDKNIREDDSSVEVSLGDLKGVQESVIHRLKQTEKDTYYITCDYPTYFPVIEYCDVEATRKSLYEVFNNRAYPQNIDVLQKLIRNFDELAKIIGYQSYADMCLSKMMVQTPARAKEFIQGLYQQSQSKIAEETKILLEHRPDVVCLDEQGKIKPWDMAYWQRFVKNKLTSVDQNLIREYFPQDHTIQGLIHIYESFFSLKISEQPAEDLWDPSLKVLKIEDKKTSLCYGYVILDLFPREGKYSHACEAGIIPSIEAEDYSTIGQCVVIANFQKTLGDNPALMSLGEVKTFFHEFGHALHELIGRTPWFATNGTHVKTDFVELPSQILEEWLSDPSILKMLSSHYKTHEPLDDATIDLIVSNKTFSSGNFVEAQCYLSILSLRYYLDGANKDTDAISRDVFYHYRQSLAFDRNTHFQASFGHLYGYGPAYYGYLWSRVFALDVFEEIKKEGLLNPSVGRRYLEEILAQGGSEDPEVLLENFLGRKPSQDAFLKSYGLCSKP